MAMEDSVPNSIHESMSLCNNIIIVISQQVSHNIPGSAPGGAVTFQWIRFYLLTYLLRHDFIIDLILYCQIKVFPVVMITED